MSENGEEIKDFIECIESSIKDGLNMDDFIKKFRRKIEDYIVQRYL